MYYQNLPYNLGNYANSSFDYHLNLNKGVGNMEYMAAAAALQAGASFYGASRSGRTNYKAMERELANQKELIDYQNAYNTPAKQMERLKAAGLNPNLMYGAISTGNQQTAGTPPDISKFMGEGSGSRVTKAMKGFADALNGLSLRSFQEEVKNKQLQNESMRLNIDTQRLYLDSERLKSAISHQTFMQALSEKQYNLQKDLNPSKIDLNQRLADYYEYQVPTGFRYYFKNYIQPLYDDAMKALLQFSNSKPREVKSLNWNLSNGNYTYHHQLPGNYF